jgi:flagellin FlaB
MLGAGFFTTQKSQEVVHTGVTQASSSIAPSGDVIVHSSADDEVNYVQFYITNTAGGTPVDLDKTVITYTDDDDFQTQDYAAAANEWDYDGVITTDGATADNLLESGEKYSINMTLDTKFAPNSPPTTNEKIKIEVKPPEGAVLTIQKTMPPALVKDEYYVVY